MWYETGVSVILYFYTFSMKTLERPKHRRLQCARIASHKQVYSILKHLTTLWRMNWSGRLRGSMSTPNCSIRLPSTSMAGAGSSRGRHGLTPETVLRCAVLLHLRGESYRGLAFTLCDSITAQRFARLDSARRSPGKSALQATVGSIGAATWEAINRRLLEVARAEKIETGDRVRVDSTVTETHILKPSDSRLLFDGVRVLTRLLREAHDELGATSVNFHDHCRAAKRKALEAGSQRGTKRRTKTYRKLLRLTRRTVGYVETALPAVVVADTPWSRSWVTSATAYLDLLGRVVAQTERAGIQGREGTGR